MVVAEVEFVPRERWASLPVQPTAGAWRRRRRWAAVAVAGSGLWVAAVGAEVLAGVQQAGLHIWDPMGPFVLVTAMGAVMGVRQARAERAEQQLGYTTVPHRRQTGAP